jgi:hypothetical protein
MLGRVVPNQPATPVRTVRIPDDLWTALRARADERGETVTDVVRRALRRYLREYDDGEL